MITNLDILLIRLRNNNGIVCLDISKSSKYIIKACKEKTLVYLVKNNKIGNLSHRDWDFFVGQHSNFILDFNGSLCC